MGAVNPSLTLSKLHYAAFKNRKARGTVNFEILAIGYGSFPESGKENWTEFFEKAAVRIGVPLDPTNRFLSPQGF
jgi:hypothetical protein